MLCGLKQILPSETSELSSFRANLLNTSPYFLLRSCPQHHKLNSFWSKKLSILQEHVSSQLIFTVATPESVSWWHDKSKAWCTSLCFKFGESCLCSAILIELSRMLRKVHADTDSGWTCTLKPITWLLLPEGGLRVNNYNFSVLSLLNL